MVLPSSRKRFALLLGLAVIIILLSYAGQTKDPYSAGVEIDVLKARGPFNTSQHAVDKRFEIPDEDHDEDPADNNDRTYHGNPQSGIELEGPEVEYKTWSEMVQRGKMLMSMMETNINDEMKSPYKSMFFSMWNNPGLQELWGWRDNSLPFGVQEEPFVVRFQNAFQKLKITINLNQHVCKVHEVDTTAGSKQFRATDAMYEWYLNTQEGVITNYASFGPRSEAKEAGFEPTDAIVLLEHWSDLTFLNWVTLAGGVFSKEVTLKYVFVAQVTEHNTKSAIKKLFQKRGLKFVPSEIGGQASFKLNVNDEEVMGLLGSPLGQGVPFMLAQHKDRLGHKIVKSIDIWDERAKRGTGVICREFT